MKLEELLGELGLGLGQPGGTGGDGDGSSNGSDGDGEPGNRTVREDSSEEEDVNADANEDNAVMNPNPAPEVDLGRLRVVRGTKKGRVTKVRTAVEAALAEDKGEAALLQLRERLQECFHDYKAAHEALLEACPTAEAAEQEEQQFFVVQDEVDMTSMILRTRLLSMERAGSGMEQVKKAMTAIEGTTLAKLPTLPPPSFDGKDPTKWMAFWEDFTALVGGRADIPDSTKMTYLRSYLSGPALASVTGIRNDADGYELAKAKLTHRYGGTRVVISRSVRSLVEYKHQGNRTEDYRATFDYLSNTVNMLNNMGVKTEAPALAEVLIPILETKVQASTLKKWEMHLGDRDEEKGANYQPTVEEFFLFVDRSLSADEKSRYKRTGHEEPQPTGAALATNGSHGAKQKATKPKHTKRSPQDKPKEGAGQTSVQTTGATIPRGPGLCVFCGKQHGSLNCPELPTLSTRHKWNRMRKTRACYMCFGTDHGLNDCPQQQELRCRVAGCVEKHNTLLHFERQSK